MQSKEEKMPVIKHLDLFSGIGGFALGLQQADADSKFYKTIAFCEINQYCQKVLEKNFPNAQKTIKSI